MANQGRLSRLALKMHCKYFLLLSTAQSQAPGLMHAKHMFCYLAALQLPAGETPRIKQVP